MSIYQYLLKELDNPPLIKSDLALCIIDMQKLDAHPDYGWGQELKRVGQFDKVQWYFDHLESTVVPNLVRLLDVFRVNDLPIIHTRVVYQSKNEAVRPRHHQRWDLHCTPESEGAQFLPELSPEPGEVVLDKPGTSAFNCTAIDQLLRNMGVNQLVVAGVNTTNCLGLTARDAIDRGYLVYIPSDTCSAIAGPEAHEAAYRDLIGFSAVPCTSGSIADEIARFGNSKEM